MLQKAMLRPTLFSLEVLVGIARDIGGSCPDVAFANSRHRHGITRPQRENRSDAAFLDM
jgi:hypothetical protein